MDGDINNEGTSGQGEVTSGGEGTSGGCVASADGGGGVTSAGGEGVASAGGGEGVASADGGEEGVVSTDSDGEGVVKDGDQDMICPEQDVLSADLPWEKDLEMISSYEEKKESLSEAYRCYVTDNPELWALLADFLQAILIQRPDDVYKFAREFFYPFNPAVPHQPSHPTTRSPHHS